MLWLVKTTIKIHYNLARLLTKTNSVYFEAECITVVVVWTKRVVISAAVERWSTVVQAEGCLLHACSDGLRQQLWRDRVGGLYSPETVSVDGR